MELGFLHKTQLVFGNGKVKEVGAHCAKLGRKGMLVTFPEDANLKPIFDAVKASLDDSGVSYVHFDRAQANPTTDEVNAGSALARAECVDFVLGVGGGSSMDTAKAIAIGAVNEGDIWKYRVIEGAPILNKPLPSVLLTTTSGTGAHLTPPAVITNSSLKYKSAVCAPDTFPDCAVVDPDLMLSLPPQVTASTGFDVFTHLFEAYIHINTNDFVRMFALEGLKRIFKFLPIAYRDPKNIIAREHVAFADCLAGYCISGCGVTLPHGICMAISGQLPTVSHGQALAMVYPQVLAFTLEKATPEFARIYSELAGNPDGLSEAVLAQKLVAHIGEFIYALGLNAATLQDFGATQADLDAIIEKTFNLPDYTFHPARAGKADVRRMVEQCWRAGQE